MLSQHNCASCVLVRPQGRHARGHPPRAVQHNGAPCVPCVLAETGTRALPLHICSMCMGTRCFHARVRCSWKRCTCGGSAALAKTAEHGLGHHGRAQKHWLFPQLAASSTRPHCTRVSRSRISPRASLPRAVVSCTCSAARGRRTAPRRRLCGDGKANFNGCVVGAAGGG